MKRLIYITAICITTGAFSNIKSQSLGRVLVNKNDGSVQLTDSFLLRLQQENDIVLATVYENNSFFINIAYRIIARKNGAWKGYVYTITSLNKIPPKTITNTNVSQSACDSALMAFQQAPTWKNKIDSAQINCEWAVDDGSTWYLLMMTPNKLSSNYYYEPQAYQHHCPDADRLSFLYATNKIDIIFGVKRYDFW